jgi:hypothetical protein
VGSVSAELLTKFLDKVIGDKVNFSSSRSSRFHGVFVRSSDVMILRWYDPNKCGVKDFLRNGFIVVLVSLDLSPQIDSFIKELIKLRDVTFQVEEFL